MSKIIYCHPDHLKLIQEIFHQTETEEFAKRIYGLHQIPIQTTLDVIGIEIHTSIHCPKWNKRWKFPEWRFVIWEESDKEWCIPLGMGYWEEDTSSPAFMVVDDTLFRHNYRKPFFVFD